jgi:hypothetical protein
MPDLILNPPSPVNLKGKIQYLWENDTALVEMHPAERFITGRVPTSKPTAADPAPPQMPYTRLELPIATRSTRTSDTEYWFQAVKFHLWTDTSDEADPIVQAIYDCYGNMGFSYELSSVTYRIIDTKFGGIAQKQIPKPNYTAWETVVTFTLRTMRNRVN